MSLEKRSIIFHLFLFLVKICQKKIMAKAYYVHMCVTKHTSVFQGYVHTYVLPMSKFTNVMSANLLFYANIS
jgi:homoserine trans-succinylase